MFGDRFQGRRVFVTGHTGFKGSWLCLWLERLGARVTGYALAPPTEPSHFVVSALDQVVDTSHQADIRDREALLAALEEAAPDIVFHLAAQSIVREGYDSPLETFDVNVMGMATLLDCLRQLGRPCAVVAVTSDKCYENREQVWGYRESDPLGEHDPYGASKGAAELVARSYRRSFFSPPGAAGPPIRLATARAGNVVGGGDWTPHALIVDIIRALAEGRPLEVRSPSATRPWQHVLQALSGYLMLGERLLASDDPVYQGAWNFGPLPGNELPVRQVVELVFAQWGGGEWLDVSDPSNAHEAGILRLAVDKAIWRLGWSPCWDIHRSLEETVRWYRRYLAGEESMRAFGRTQIAAYEEALTAQPKGTA